MLIYHVALAGDWDAAQAVGSYRISTRGRSLDDEGFIHCSYADQVSGVAQTFYSDVTEPIVLLAIDTGRLGSEVIAENTGGGIELFPHVYGPIPTAAVRSVTALSRDVGGQILVPGLAAAAGGAGSGQSDSGLSSARDSAGA